MITNEILSKLGIEEKWLQSLINTFEKFEINTPKRMASFIGQCMHESGNFKHLEENLNYSAVRLTQVFPNRFTLAKATEYTETKTALSSGAIDLSTGNYFTYTVSGSTTFTVSNGASSGTVNSFILDLTNGGSATITWISGTKWAGGTAPTLTSSGRDVLGFFTEDGGTTWNGFVLGKAMA